MIGSSSQNIKPQLLGRSSATGRWATLGPYYAMFPVGFVLNAIETYSGANSTILDPFCGRGTVPFISKATGRHSLGIDINPVAYVFSAAKTDPEPNLEALIRRIEDISDGIDQRDKEAENEFQEWAWCSDVLGFLNSARRLLDWRGNQTDRTLMAIILVHLHAKIGTGVSNQMRQSKGMAPNYSVNWWKSRDMHPPLMDPKAYFISRVQWRYKKGIVEGPAADIILGDATYELQHVKRRNINLLLTSPPYCGVTNYALDNWIRLWLLGGPSLPDWDSSQKYSNKEKYTTLLSDVLGASKPLLSRDALIYIRTDSRVFTRNTTLKVLNKLWPKHNFFWYSDTPSRSQTELFGDHTPKPGETDILVTKDISKVPSFFTEVPSEFLGNIIKK